MRHSEVREIFEYFAIVLCLLVGAAASVVKADSFAYYPQNVSSPFLWSEPKSWYTNSTAFNVLPTAFHGVVPAASDDVAVNAWGGVSLSSPVTVGADDTVTVQNLYLACNGDSKPYYGAGAALTVDGGMLNVKGNLIFSSGIYSYGTLFLSNGAKMHISGDAHMGENNYTTAGNCRTEIDSSSSLTVDGMMTVGIRSRCAPSIVTNNGSLTVGTLQIGPSSSSYIGTGVVFNAGSLVVSGNLDLGGMGKGNGKGGSTQSDIRSCGTLVLAEESSLTLGESSKIYVGGNNPDTYGDGILDTSIPIVLTGNQSISIGNAYSNAVNGGVLILRKSARLDNSSPLLDIGNLQYGRAAIRMYDDSMITNVTKIRFGETKAVDATLEMHDRAMITNVATLRLSETARSGSKAHILMDGNSIIHFNCTEAVNEGSGLWLASEPDNKAEVVLKDNARMTGLYRLNASTVYPGYEVRIRLEGGAIEFKPQDYSSRDSLRLGRAENEEEGVASVSGYGVFTRLDIQALDPNKYLPMICRMHDFSFTADGCGEMRDLDLSAFSQVNEECYGNHSGTNGWYAINKGRLLFPRASKFVGRREGSPASQIGDYHVPGTNSFGESNPPCLVNAFTLEPDASVGFTKGKAYCHAALYAPDRTDYPSLYLSEDKAKVVSVWRIGTCKAGWNTSVPTSPWDDWKTMKVTFCYDSSAFDETKSAVLYRHDGTADGVWRRVATVESPNQTNIISATIAPGTGVYDIGWFALVAKSRTGTVFVIR